MPNVGKSVYNALRKELNREVKNLYFYEKSLQNSHHARRRGGYFFKLLDTVLFTLILKMCILILNDGKLKKSAALAPSIVPQIQEQSRKLMALMIDLHNTCITRRGNMSHELTSYILDKHTEMEICTESISDHCNTLVCSSDFLDPGFLPLCFYVATIELACKRLEDRVRRDVEHKIHGITNGNYHALFASLSLRQGHIIPQDYVIEEPDVASVTNNLLSISDVCKSLEQKRRDFFLNSMPLVHGCSFVELLDTMCRASTCYIPGQQVWLVGGTPIITYDTALTGEVGIGAISQEGYGIRDFGADTSDGPNNPQPGPSTEITSHRDYSADNRCSYTNDDPNNPQPGPSTEVTPHRDYSADNRCSYTNDDPNNPQPGPSTEITSHRDYSADNRCSYTSDDPNNPQPGPSTEVTPHRDYSADNRCSYTNDDPNNPQPGPSTEITLDWGCSDGSRNSDTNDDHDTPQPDPSTEVTSHWYRSADSRDSYTNDDPNNPQPGPSSTVTSFKWHYYHGQSRTYYQ